MRVDWTSDPRDFVREDWTDLVARDPEATFFHTPRYLKLYWEELATGSLELAFVRDGDERVGAAAFELSDGVLRFLGGSDVTDYMGPVAAPDWTERAGKELLASLAARDDWRRADLHGLVEEETWAVALSSAAGDVGLRAAVEEDGVAPFLELPETFDEYLAGLDTKRRHEIRRKERRIAERLSQPHIVDATEETLREDVDRFVWWHRQSRGAKGRFMVPGMELFFRRLADELVPERSLRLSFLEAGGRRLAGMIGFRDRRRFLLYNSAYARGERPLAPGMVLLSLLIRDAIESGYEGFDFLHGDLPYKYRFGARPRRLVRLVLERG